MRQSCRLAIFLAAAVPWTAAQFAYPEAKKSDVVDDYHGAKVADPYRWLEDTDSPETAAWVAAENRLTRSYLAGIPSLARLRDRLTTLFNYERYTGLQKAGGGYLLLRNDGLQNQNVLYAADALAGKERLLLDPNTLRADGTAALSGHVPSPDGKLLAYGIAEAGSDWCQWRVRKIENGQDLPDTIRWNKFIDIEWTPDSRGFYYLRFPEPKAGEALRGENTFSRLYLHRLGEPQSADRLIYERPDRKHWMFVPQVTDDGRYLVIVVAVGDFGKNLLFYQDLRSPQPRTVELIRNLEAGYLPLGNHGSVFYLHTTDLAPRGRIVAVDFSRPQRENWREVVPQQNATIEGATMIKGRLAVAYVQDAASQVRTYDLKGRPGKTVPLPGIGSVQFLPGRPRHTEMFFAFNSYTAPKTICRLDAATEDLTIVRRSKLSFDPERFETERVFYQSRDGARIPMSLVHRKGMPRDGNNPTVLTGYGGFNISILPGFSPWAIAWMEMGGLYAEANLRGGGEYGEVWHEAGKRANKQNVFDDFIAAAEWLVARRYTAAPRLAIFGASNGGLLVGAALNQRPDLFGAAMPAVGVMDMLRFQKFTIGATWTDEYGSSDNAGDFQVLRAYSPLHNIRNGVRYPPVLITTSDHDDRVVPGHSFKYAATLQAAQAGAAPILIRIETRAGHGGGKPTAKIIEEGADRLAFLARELHVELPR